MATPDPKSPTICCPVEGAGLPSFKVVVGRDEVEGKTSYGVDPISQTLADRTGIPNASLLELMLKLSRPGQLVLDVGAHVGMFTLTAAAAGRRVLAVEASSRNHGLLTQSLEVNGFRDRVELVHA